MENTQDKERIRATKGRYREKNRDEINAKSRLYYRKTIDQQRIRQKRWLSRNPGAKAAGARKASYGITKEQYKNMLGEQDNCCLICGDEFSKIDKSRRTSVDHCHTLNKIRGLLCHNCNTGLGFFRDSSIRLRKAAAYLENFS